MKIRPIALLAMLVPGCLNAAPAPRAPLAVYYSFDTPPAAALVTELQAEMARILAPAGLRVAWRAIEAPRGGEDFPGIVVLRFHGRCFFTQDSWASQRAPDPAGTSLAATELDGAHVLPFAGVDCDHLRRFLAPVLRSSGVEDKTTALGRAMARVSAHEIYHVLTGAESHAHSGIARASHSRADLVAPTFAFARTETNWIRAWADKQAGQGSSEATESGEIASDAGSLEAAGVAGR